MNYMLYQAKITYKSVVFNLFYAVTHFSTQCNVTTPFWKFSVRHMKCSCVCTT